MEKLLHFCRNAFSGLAREAWLLSLMVVINRSGAIVLPFMSVYVSEVLHFSLTETGLILSIYGLGSVLSSLIGGWLTDRFGHFSVQFLSQVVGGVLYLLLMQVEAFWQLAASVFLLALINDCLKPANGTAVAQYATPDTLTRSFSLNRMAVNVGFALGPAVGGMLAAISFKWLFVANGVTSILAGIFFFVCFHKSQKSTVHQAHPEQNTTTTAGSPYKDLPFLLFVFLCCCFAIIFYQLFSTLPLYYKQQYQLSEENIGLLMSLNGVTILLTEMFLIYLLARYTKKSIAILAGVLLLGISFMLFNVVQHASILLFSMILFSLAEILAMPFMSSITAERAQRRNRGAYMGLFTVTYALPLVLSPFLGTSIVSYYGFTALWWVSGALAVATAIGLYYTVRCMEQSGLADDQPATPAAFAQTVLKDSTAQKIL